MSAGIVSACLPTLRPAMQKVARAVGIKGSMGGMFRATTALGFGSKNSKSNFSNGLSSREDPTGSQIARNLSTKHGAGNDAFYRLSDDNTSDGNREEGGGSKLRPDTNNHGFGYTVSSYPVKERDDKSEDEIPLHAIRVQKDFKQTTS